MQVVISDTPQEMGRRAAHDGAEKIRQAIARNGKANIVVATGASQFEVFANLTTAPGIDWGRVTAFHLDEYCGMPITHPASFRKYLRERFVEKLPQPLAAFHYINAEGNAAAECQILNGVIAAHPIDVAFVGIGENGHLAFNDPPADFVTEVPYIVVNLDEACRRQQLGEGWFPTLEDVPRQAISMSIRQIMKAQSILCSVPDARKADAVKKTLEGPVTPDAPASILQQHPDTTVYLDAASAARLQNR